MATTAQRKAFPREVHSGRAISSGGKASGENDADSEGIWLSMLDDVSRGKNLAEKQLVVLGGTPEQQHQFLNTLHPHPSSKPRYSEQRHGRDDSKPPPLSNRFALGYTYHDVLDTDEQDILARLSVYMLSDPSAAFAPLLKSLFTVKSVPNCLIVILLDWADVFGWAAELRQWIRVLRGVVTGLGEDVRQVMAEVMEGWKARGGPGDGGATTTNATAGGKGSGAETASSTSILLGPGEWEDEVGVPVCVVCTNAEKQERMEKDFGWQEGDFDFLLQWMRCVLLKHGASLIYTTSFDSNNVQTLIHSKLGIQSLLKRGTIRHNIIDRDKILIPPNWDSWGKIRILREGFEMEAVANAWSAEIQARPETEYDRSTVKSGSDEGARSEGPYGPRQKTTHQSAVSILLSSLPNPSATQKPYVPSTATNDVVTAPDTQTFLAEQARRLEKMRLDDEQTEKRNRKADHRSVEGGSRAATEIEPTGPYNVNVGGIQVDAEEMTRQIKQREADREREREQEVEKQRQRHRDLERERTRGREREKKEKGKEILTPRKDSPASTTTTATAPGNRKPPDSSSAGTATPEGAKAKPEVLASYFANLMKNAEKKESPRRSDSAASAEK